MDFFYKPPMQRPDECAALEENYVNCLMQKALKDRVLNNRCVMDSILWFHLECPKHAQAFDDPGHFKLKFRDFFATAKHDAQLNFELPERLEKLREEYDGYMGPDDVRYKNQVQEFEQEFKDQSPARVVDEEDGDFLETFWDNMSDSK